MGTAHLSDTRVSEFDANKELARRADAARQTCCNDEPDDLSAARGIVIAMPIGITLWIIALAVVIWLWN